MSPLKSLVENLVNEVDIALRTLMPPTHRPAKRQSPALGLNEHPLSTQEKRHVAGLMRVNHAGEVCAQALYQGQALTAQLAKIKAQMTQAAEEEIDHLAWCEERLRELDSQPSLLNPFWYFGSFLLGKVDEGDADGGEESNEGEHDKQNNAAPLATPSSWKKHSTPHDPERWGEKL